MREMTTITNAVCATMIVAVLQIAERIDLLKFYQAGFSRAVRTLSTGFSPEALGLTCRNVSSEILQEAGMAENKTQPTKVSVAKFIETITDETRRADAKALVKMMQSASGEKPTMWGPAIVGFGSYPLQVRQRTRRRYADYRFFAAQGRKRAVWRDRVQRR